jgi:hypothetical protein
MLHKTIKKIHSFRIFFLCFIILAFLLNLGLDPIDVGKFVGAKLGSAVGMGVSIPENPFNKVALQLKEKEEKLALKEIELYEREMAISKTDSESGLLTYLLGGGIIFLFILILLNFYLDYVRKKKT